MERQCALLGLSRSGYYYVPVGESEQNLLLMRLLDEQYLLTPFYGQRRMQWRLGQQGHAVNLKRVGRLMRLMGLETLYPKPNLSKPCPGHKVYPYLLRGVSVERVDQVWSTDITYIPMERGFLYLVAVIDWYSRYVLSWRLSNSLEAGFCVEALEQALEGGKPQIFNTDQGSQFTSEAFTGVLLGAQVQISMDGRGRALDNIFVERLWRTVKYEYVYLQAAQDGQQLWEGLDGYFRFYNHERPHQSLGYQTPAQVYFSQMRP